MSRVNRGCMFTLFTDSGKIEAITKHFVVAGFLSRDVFFGAQLGFFLGLRTAKPN